MNVAMILKPKAVVSYIYADVIASVALKEFIDMGYTAVPVINREGIYLGVVSERDFLYYMIENGRKSMMDNVEMTVGDLLHENRFLPVQIDASMDELFARIIEQNFVPVVDSRDMFSGIVTRRDVLLYSKKKNDKGE